MDILALATACGLAASSPIFATASDQSGCPTAAFAGEPPARINADGLTDRWSAEIAMASARFAIPASWIRGVMQQESRGIPTATSPVGAMGLMQIMPSTWAALRGRYGLGDDPYAPRDNIVAGAAYIRELFDRYGVPGFLAAYNAGSGRIDDHLFRGRPLPDETQRYVASLAPMITGTDKVTSKPLPVLDEIRAKDRAAHLVTGRTSDGIFIQALRAPSAADVEPDAVSSATSTAAPDAVAMQGEASRSDLFAVLKRQGGEW